MLTSTADLAGPRRAARRSWLLAVLVLGILGMHGLVGGAGSTGVHHAWTPGHAAAASVTTDAGPVADTSGAGHGAHASHDEPAEGTALALCLVLLMALGAGLLTARAGSWQLRPRRTATRLCLPAAPLLRDSTPVPRFTVMRC